MFLEMKCEELKELLKYAENKKLKIMVSENNEEIEIFPYNYEYRLKEFKLKISVPKNSELLFKTIHKKIKSITNKEISLKVEIEDRFNIKIVEVENMDVES